MPMASVEAGTDDEGNEYILEARLEEALSRVLQAGLTDEPAAIQPDCASNFTP